MGRNRYLRKLIPTSFNMRPEVYERWIKRFPDHGRRTLVLNILIELLLDDKVSINQVEAAIIQGKLQNGESNG